MIWLILNILVSGILYLIFRLFPKYKVDNLVAVIVNYLTASTLGLIMMDTDIAGVIARPWFPIAFCMGIFFIFIFLLMAESSQVNGISMTSVANKMSLIIPVIAGIFLYNESITWLMVTGIILALVSVIFTSIKDKSMALSKNGTFILMLIFFGSGLIDIMIKYMQHHYLTENEGAAFVMVIFMAAAIFGLLWMLLTQRDRFRNFNKASIVGGIALGIPNFGSIYFLILALEKSGFQSSVLYPINNMGIVGISALFGILIFKEKINLINFIGILLAIAAIALIAFGK
jgi:drug/metabolite transporter (DMT)-like permease